MEKIDLKLVSDQLTEAIGIKDDRKVMSIINEEYDNEFLGWHIVRFGENGEVIPMLGTRCSSLKEFFETFYGKID